MLEEQEDGILEERPPLREVLRHWWEKLTQGPQRRPPSRRIRRPCGSSRRSLQPEPEPDLAGYGRLSGAEKRRRARLKRQCWCVLPEAVLLTVLSVLDGLGLDIPRLWAALPVLGDHPRRIAALALALSGRVWRSARKPVPAPHHLRGGAAGIAGVFRGLRLRRLGLRGALPLAAVPVISLPLCLWGQLLAAKARLAGFRLADLGGEPPHNVSVTTAGLQAQGTAEGFYRSPTSRMSPIAGRSS